MFVFISDSICAVIAQLGERQTEDLKVPGSIPGLGNMTNGASSDVAHVFKHILNIMDPSILGPGFEHLFHFYNKCPSCLHQIKITPRPGIEPGSSA